MIGLEVQDTKGNVLGTLTDVLQPGANDVYVVSKEGEPDQLLRPLMMLSLTSIWTNA